MAQHLGDLGQKKAALDVTFGWFGATIRSNPQASPELELTDFMARAKDIDLGDVDPANATEEDFKAAAGAMEAVRDFLRAQLHPEDWEQFWALAKANQQDVQDLMQVAMRLTEVAAGFPTGRPSSSPAGRSRTERRSRGGSSSRATKALRIVPGRPDLQAAIMRATEAQEAGRKASA